MHVHCCTCIYSLTYTRRVRERESREKKKERETENADQGRRDTTSSRWNVQRDDAAAALYASSDRCCSPCKDVALASREPSLSVFLFLSFILPLPRFFFFCSLLYRGFRAIRTRACGGVGSRISERVPAIGSFRDFTRRQRMDAVSVLIGSFSGFYGGAKRVASLNGTTREWTFLVGCNFGLSRLAG